MNPLRFGFVLHIHQPIGNFDFVFREHADDVYRPFLDFLEERELWPIGLHVSGPLLEWLGEHDAGLHDRIGRLVADGRIELLGAGWYEPILASLDPVDRATQLGWMREELERRFGVTPRGVWLTERVWTPSLAADLADAGIDHTLVDDHLLRRAGATAAELLRPSRARHEGREVGVLAIDESLRYLIPFRPAEEVGDELRRRHAAGDPLALFADDGEKFGGWPRTREWLYDQGWLAAFGDQMDALRSDGVVRLVTTSTACIELGEGPVLDLPEGSYAEMDGWAGGPWTGFLDRYREAGRIHRWMTELSEECRERGDPVSVRRAIGRGQCNDAYWHGVFGGIYMKHLREGVRGWLAKAEAELLEGAPLSWEPGKDRDGSLVHRVRSARLSARVSGAAGGTLTELVWLDPHMDVTDFLTRRREQYHHEGVGRGEDDGDAASETSARADGGSVSIHEIEETARLDRLPPIDRDVRVLVRDRVLPGSVALDSYREGEAPALWMAADGSLDPPACREDAAGRGTVITWRFRAGAPGTPRKTLRLWEEGLELEWVWDPGRFDEGAYFCPEFSLACAVDLEFDPIPAEVWTCPIVTTSKCPDGFEEIEQGRSVTPRWPAHLGRARGVLLRDGSSAPGAEPRRS